MQSQAQVWASSVHVISGHDLGQPRVHELSGWEVSIFNVAHVVELHIVAGMRAWSVYESARDLIKQPGLCILSSR